MRATLSLVLVSILAASDASAQAVPESRGQEVIVVNDRGEERSGQLLMFGPDQLIVAVNGQPITIERARISAIFEPGDSVTDGAKLGLLAGPALAGAFALAGEELGPAGFAMAAFTSLIGMGIGAGIDASTHGRTLIYGGAKAGGQGVQAPPSMPVMLSTVPKRHYTAKGAALRGFKMGVGLGFFLGGAIGCSDVHPGNPRQSCAARAAKGGAIGGLVTGTIGAGMGALFGRSR